MGRGMVGCDGVGRDMAGQGGVGLAGVGATEGTSVRFLSL